MNPQRLLPIAFLVVILVAAGTGLTTARELAPAAPRAPDAPLGTAFTYQGRLESAGEPVTASCDLAFRLYNTEVGGAHVGSAITETLSVDEGLFTAQLDFGVGAFEGDAHWLDIQVRCPSDPAFTSLGRQALTAAPYALSAGRALTATQALAAPWSGLTGVPADLADGDDDTTYSPGNQLDLSGTTFDVVEGAGSDLDADLLDGQHGAYYRSWPNLTDVPADFADGTDNVNDADADPANEFNTDLTLNDTTLELTDAGGTQSADLAVFQQHYANVIVVAKSGSDFTSIQAALDSVADASSTNRYLVRVMPGVYTETVTMKRYVDIEGSGELTTRITHPGSWELETGTVVGADDAEVRFLTVANTGGATYAVAIFNGSASPRLTHVTANASGGAHNYGVSNASASPWLTHVTASASGGEVSYGVLNRVSSSTMTDVIASGSEGYTNAGVFNNVGSPTMTNVTASASGGHQSSGVANYFASPTMTNVTASASGGTLSFGVYNYHSSLTVHDCTIRATGGANANYGIYNVYHNARGGSCTVRVSNSQVTGDLNTIHNDEEFTTRIGATLLDGGEVTGPGTTTCAGVYDEDYTFYASTCP